MYVLLALAACETPVVDDGSVAWSGWVFTGTDTTEAARFSEGAVTFWPAPYTDSAQVAAEQPYEDYPGYWSAALEPGAPVLVRLTSEATRPTVWAGDVPSADGTWFAGALFAVDDAWLEAAFESLGRDGDAWLARALAGEVVVLGYPANADVRCEELVVEPAEGAAVQPTCWRVDDAGEVEVVVTGEVTWFAAHVPAGAVRLVVGGAAEDYVAEAGDVVMAWYLTGGGG